MVSPSNDSQLQFVFQTFKRDLQFNIYKFIRFYNIFRTILSIRINNRFIYTDTITNLQKLIVLKKKVIVRKVFNLDSRRFLSRIYNIENIANQLLTIYDAIYIGLY